MTRIILFITTLSLLVNSLFAQNQNISISFDDVKVDGTSISKGSPIDLGTTDEVGVSLNVDLNKDVNYTIGEATLFIQVYDGSDFTDLIN